MNHGGERLWKTLVRICEALNYGILDVIELEQAGHFYAALNLPEVSSVDVTHFREPVSS